MKIVILTLALIFVADTAVVPEEAKAEIKSYENNNDAAGNYHFSFVTSNGITREETGRLVNIGEENEHIEVEGFYSYIDADGNLVEVRYTAGENGYVTYKPILAVPKKRIFAPAVASLLGK